MNDDYLKLLNKISTSTISPDLLKKLSNLSTNVKDPLTNLLDYRSFLFNLKKDLENFREGFLVTLSIDNIQELNLLSGWMVGDIAIATFASFFQQMPGEKDLSGRLSGATFILFIHNLHIKELHKWLNQASKFISAIELPGLELFPEEKLTYSAGVFYIKEPTISTEVAMLESKKRLLFAQKQGGNKISLLSGDFDNMDQDLFKQYQLKVKKNSEKEYSHANIVQISFTGMTLDCCFPVLVRESIHIVLANDTENSLNMNGEVVWRKPSEHNDYTFCLGVRFNNLNKKEINSLENLLS